MLRVAPAPPPSAPPPAPSDPNAGVARALRDAPPCAATEGERRGAGCQRTPPGVSPATCSPGRRSTGRRAPEPGGVSPPRSHKWAPGTQGNAPPPWGPSGPVRGKEGTRGPAHHTRGRSGSACVRGGAHGGGGGAPGGGDGGGRGAALWPPARAQKTGVSSAAARPAPTQRLSLCGQSRLRTRALGRIGARAPWAGRGAPLPRPEPQPYRDLGWGA